MYNTPSDAMAMVGEFWRVYRIKIELGVYVYLGARTVAVNDTSWDLLTGWPEFSHSLSQYLTS